MLIPPHEYALGGTGEGIEARPRVPRPGTAPRRPAGAPSLRNTAPRNASRRPGNPMGSGAHGCHEGREEGNVARWRAHPQGGGAPNPLGFGQGRRRGGLSR